jgi:hypothetical protein
VEHELWLVTPAFQRLAMTAVCLRQRRELCDALSDAGIAATCVVVANDENLELAAELGFHTVEVNNSWLGRKFSAGYKYALARGATHLMPIGSDSWMDPAVVLALDLSLPVLWGTERLTSVRPDGQERLELRFRNTIGFGIASVYPRASMADVPYPCAPNIKRGCDTSTYNRTARAKGMETRYSDVHPHEYTDFKSPDVQVTKYDVLKARWRRNTVKSVTGDEVFDGLVPTYGAELVAELRGVYGL